MTYQIFYPSGKTFKLIGRLRLLEIDALLLPTIMRTREETMNVLDQRARVVDEHGVEVYHPRKIPRDRIDPSIAKWLEEHPEWASRA